MKTQDTICRKCGGNAMSSQALLNSFTSYDDFGGDAGRRGSTMSRQGEARITACYKCESCGHSWIPKTDRELSLKWWNALELLEQQQLAYDYSQKWKRWTPVSHVTLTNREVEEIWRNENITTPEKMQEVFSEPKQKQYRQFSPELFKAYINKFSKEDKVEMLKYLITKVKEEYTIKS